MKRIIFIGYMGSGKTTIGRQLAQSMNLSFYDLDWYIETRMHQSIEQIFDERGEEEFRRIEYNMLHEVAEFENVVISCGGGTPCFFDNIDYMNQQAETIYLKASPEVLCRHLEMRRKERPLLKGKTPEELKTFINVQLVIREQYYNKARHILNIDLLDNYKKIELTLEKIKELIEA